MLLLRITANVREWQNSSALAIACTADADAIKIAPLHQKNVVVAR
jgi:hypothetical protein